MDARLKKGIQEFNSGKFFEAHETWEDLWQELQTPEKQIFQGVIQCSVALHLIQEDRLVGAEKVWQRAQNNFQNAHSQIFCIDLDDLRAQMQKVFNDLKGFSPLNVKISLVNQ